MIEKIIAVEGENKETKQQFNVVMQMLF